jgi:hypothetical protein
LVTKIFSSTNFTPKTAAKQRTPQQHFIRFEAKIVKIDDKIKPINNNRFLKAEALKSDRKRQCWRSLSRPILK